MKSESYPILTTESQPIADMGATAAQGVPPLQATDAALRAGTIAGDPSATQQYVESLLDGLSRLNEAGRLLEVLPPLW